MRHMIRRSALVLVLAVLISFAALPSHTSALTPGAIDLTIDCDGFSGTAFVTFDRENNGNTVSERWRVMARDGAGSVIYDTGTLTTGGISLPFPSADLVTVLDFFFGTAWQSPPQSNPITMTIYSLAGTDSSGAPVGEVSYLLAQGTCSALTGGCDTLLALSSTAVVGQFVADADLYWAVGNLTSPLATITASNTAWVLGKDASGEYYKIAWVCNYYWVKVNTMGPNPDAVWNNTPLPTGVVQ